MRLMREELAYAAGLFEGEGCITTHNTGTRPASLVSVTMTDLEPLERFHAAVGMGRIKSTKPTSTGKPCYRYYLQTFEQVQALMAMLWPWLGPRRRARAAEVLRADRTRGVKASIVYQMFGRPYRKLNAAEISELRAAYRRAGRSSA